ncbi:MAG: hypothetical protein H5U40_11935, partial [Polyangiaceae bacterium]|nr:hypothetical protein [Polyangiaceae bacterium]
KLGSFGFSIPFAGAEANLLIHNGLAKYNMTTGEGTLGGIVNIGSSETYTVELGMNAEEGTLFRTIYDVVAFAMLEELADEELIAGVLSEISDSNATTGGSCNAMSIGLDFTATAL